MTWETKNMPPKKNLSRGPLVIGVMLMRTWTPTRTPMQTAVKQYVEPHHTGGRPVIFDNDRVNHGYTLTWVNLTKSGRIGMVHVVQLLTVGYICLARS